MYSAMLNLKGCQITIIGGGKVAYRKAALLIEEECEIKMIAPSFIEAFKVLGKSVHKVYKAYEEGDCAGSTLVFAATDDPLLNQQIGQYCKQAHIFCNVADNKELSTFFTPAQFKRGDLVISVSTGGNSPSLAAKIKEDLASHYGEVYEGHLKLLGELREKVLTTETDEAKKKEILNHIATLSLEELKEYAKR